MYPRWFSFAVVLFWLATMSWLVIEKVLPPLLLGQPPSYRTIIEARASEPTVAWEISWNDRPIGWALSSLKRHPDGVTDIRSRVHFDHLPIVEMLPDWGRKLFPSLLRVADKTEMDTRSTLTIDPLGRLSQVVSSVRVEPLADEITVRGTVEGGYLMLSVRSLGAAYTTQVPIRSDSLLSDALAPQTRLPGLHKGQSWEVRTYSPLRPPNSPSELLQATVEAVKPIVWDGRPVDTWLVVYRSVAGVSLTTARSPRQKLWVRRDGTVLKEQVTILNSTMAFDRLPAEQAAALAEEVGDL